MPLAHNNCRSLVTRCKVKDCPHVSKSHASLVYETGGDGIPTHQVWETTYFHEHSGAHAAVTTTNTSHQPYTATDFAVSLQNSQVVIADRTAAVIRGQCDLLSIIKLSGSMLTEIKKKLVLLVEGKFEETIDLIPSLITQWRAGGNFVEVEVVDGAELENMAIGFARKAWKKEMKSKEDKDKEPFDETLVNTSGINKEHRYPISFQVAHTGLGQLADGDCGRRLDQDASHNKGALHGMHFGILSKTGGHQLLYHMIGWSMRNEGAQFWTNANGAMKKAYPQRLEKPGKCSVLCELVYELCFFFEHVLTVPTSLFPP